MESHRYRIRQRLRELCPGLYYCMQVNFTISVSSVYPILTTTTSTTTTSSSTDASTTTTGSSVTTSTPIEPGMVDGCTAFHLVA
ncbi:hypothetical protein BDW71DRAFT_181775, partial [Aspergillus fruticulosus]